MIENENSGIDEILGTVREINSGTAITDLRTTLAKHREAIKRLDTNSAEGRQQIDRMQADTIRRMQAAKEQASAVWIPAGDTSDVDRRYFSDEGIDSPRLNTTTERSYRPDGEVVEHQRDGLLTARAGTSMEHERLIRSYQALAFAWLITSKSNRTGGSIWASPLVSRQYKRFTRAARDLGGRSGAWFRRVLSDPNLFKRVISGTSGSGGELISQPTISSVRRPTDLARRVPGLITNREIVSSTFKAPVVTGRGLSKKRGTTQADPSRYPVANFTSSEVSISVFDRTIMALLDSLWATDNGLVLGDPIGFVLDWLMSGDADSLEMAFLHGDTNATHQDALATWTMGGLYTAGDLDGTDSMLAAWIGFRARAADDSKTVSAGGTLAVSDHFGAMDLLGTRAGTGGVVAITGLHALYTQVVYVDTTAYVHYEHSAGADDFDISYPERGAQYVGMVKRSVLTPEVISTEAPCAVLYNL